MGEKSSLPILSWKTKEETDVMALQVVFHEATSEFNLDWGVVVTVRSEDNGGMVHTNVGWNVMPINL